MHRFIKILAFAVFAALAGMIFWLVVTGRGETVVPASVRQYPIKGVDVSAHNGQVDFTAMRQAGFGFAYIKATEGVTFKDPMFLTNLNKAREAGMATGAYHFFRFDRSGYMQALNLLNSVRGHKIDLPLAIDVEEWTNPSDRTADNIASEIRDMTDKLISEGYRVMIYTNRNGYERIVRGRLDDMPLWLCSFRDIEADVGWALWQYSHRGIIEGVDRITDLNVYSGDSASWRTFTMQ